MSITARHCPRNRRQAAINNGTATEGHRGSVKAFLKLHHDQCASLTGERRQDLSKRLYDRVLDFRNLIAAFEHVLRHGGQTPGRDGLRADDLVRGEVISLVKAIQKAIRRGRMRCGLPRAVKIRKSGGAGMRTIQIYGLVDRVLGRALVQILAPFSEPLFCDRTFARPLRGVYHAVATAMHFVGNGSHPFAISEDLVDAFGSVSLGRLRTILKRLLPQRLVELVFCSLGQPTGRGLPTGNSLSPLLLNLILNYVLDRPWAKRHPHSPLLRYVDDLFIASADAQEWQQADRELTAVLLPTGFQRKYGTLGCRRLDDEKGIEWLGFQFKLEDGARCSVRIAEKRWKSLEERLSQAHMHFDPPESAFAAVSGWVGEAGAAFPWENPERVFARVQGLLAANRLDVVLGLERFRKIWRDGFLRFRRIAGVVAGTSPP